MEIDGEKLEQAVLALLYLNSFGEGEGKRAWKSFPWSVMDSLHEKLTAAMAMPTGRHSPITPLTRTLLCREGQVLNPRTLVWWQLEGRRSWLAKLFFFIGLASHGEIHYVEPRKNAGQNCP